ncbi:protein of unknown function [Trichlorobacter ammonificans]|uniref:Uncharacterized protein n=1 Tax=Trichlorobacter ammonificans TaxID=2916410 RepID=A0ABM9D6H3_9BACT|nr:protein of unknown function [Trichlorobacter ammonificans]
MGHGYQARTKTHTTPHKHPTTRNFIHDVTLTI